jgi:hypothetical protein
MLKPFSYTGAWHVPGNDRLLRGTLHFDPVVGASLDVFGSFDHTSMDPRNIDIILGETHEGKVTLLHCHQMNARITGGIVNTSYYVAIIFEGVHFAALPAIRFTKIYFELFNFFEWIDRWRLKYSATEDRDRISVHYEREKAIPFTLHEHCNGSIYFFSLSSSQAMPHNITIDERCEVILAFDESRDFEEMLSEMTIFYQFISLCTYEQSYPTAISFTSPDIQSTFQSDGISKTWDNIIRCHFSNTYYKPQFKSRRTDEHILPFANIASNFSNVISGWYTHYKQIEPAFILLLRFFQGKLTMSTEKFMDQARAIETFHRRTANIDKMSADKYDAIVERIKHEFHLSPEEREIIETRLSYGYEPSLRERVKDMLNQFGNPLIDYYVPDQDAFVKDVVKNRNFYTHFVKKKNWEPLKGLALQQVADRIMLVLICAIFKIIGVEYEQYQQGLQRQYSRRLGVRG